MVSFLSLHLYSNAEAIPMPSLDTVSPEQSFIRILYVGNSGAGKTGSLVSLVKAGYRVRLIDLDNGFGILKQYVLHECPDKIGNVSVVSYRDKYKATPAGIQVNGVPTAYINTMKALDKWPDDESNPAEWGANSRPRHRLPHPARRGQLRVAVPPKPGSPGQAADLQTRPGLHHRIPAEPDVRVLPDQRHRLHPHQVQRDRNARLC